MWRSKTLLVLCGSDYVCYYVYCRYENYCREHISREKHAERLQNLPRQEYDISSTADVDHVIVSHFVLLE